VKKKNVSTRGIEICSYGAEGGERVKRQEKGEGEYWLDKAMNLQCKQHLLQREDTQICKLQI
jgi:hypothetical protein